MSEHPRRLSTNRLVVWLVLGVLVVAFLAGAVVYTEQPSFCKTCHEMQPYYDAWASGKHTEVSCIECHVAPGVPARFMHKFVALQEVWYHFTTKPTFPSLTVDVPDSRCTPCHESVDIKIAKDLTHTEHAKALACQQCHASAGHRITYAALDSAGILRAGTQPKGGLVVGESIAAEGAHGELKGHKSVACSSCHDMATEQCSLCHKTPSKHFASECKGCHDPSKKFEDAVFDHPRMEKHTYRSFPCVNCHPVSLKSASCDKCHKGGAPSED